MKHKLKTSKKPSADVALQITSMADIFTILLVFLIKSFSSDTSKITPNEKIALPESGRAAPFSESLKLEISQSSILLDNKPICELTNFNFDGTDLEGNGTSRTLNTAFIGERKKDTLVTNPKLLVLSDQNAPFSTLKRVLASASNNGFVDFKLVVVKNDP